MLPIALNPLIMRAVVVGKLVLCPFQDGYFVCLKDKPPTPWEWSDELVTCVPTGRDFSEPVYACQSAFSETTTGIQKGCARTPYVATDHRNGTCLKLAQPRRGDNTKSAIGYTQKANTSRFGHGTKNIQKDLASPSTRWVHARSERYPSPSPGPQERCPSHSAGREAMLRIIHLRRPKTEQPLLGVR